MASWLDELSSWDKTWGVKGRAVDVGSDLATDDLPPGAPTSGSAILGIQSAVDHLNVLGDALRALGFDGRLGTTRSLALPSSLRRGPSGFSAPRSGPVAKSGACGWSGIAIDPSGSPSFSSRLSPIPDPEQSPNKWPIGSCPSPGHADCRGRNARSRPHRQTCAQRHGDRGTQRGSLLQGLQVDRSLGSGLAWQWRTHSGSADSYPWVLVGKADLETTYLDGTGEGTFSPSVEDLGLAFGTGMSATREAMRLFLARASAVSDPPSA